MTRDNYLGAYLERMGLGSTAKKIQLVSDRAEQMYNQVQDLQNRIITLEEEVDDTHQTVRKIDHELAEHRAVLHAIADEFDLDPEAIAAEVAIEDVDEHTEEGVEEATESQTADDQQE